MNRPASGLRTLAVAVLGSFFFVTACATPTKSVSASADVAASEPVSTQGGLYIAAMRAALRNGVTAQESYFGKTRGSYLSGVASNVGGAAKPLAALGDFVPSAGVTITFTATGGTGWSAVATHSATTKTCAIFYGDVAAVAPATIVGEPKCT